MYVRRRDLIMGWKHPPSAALAARFLAARANGPLTDCGGFGEFVTSLGGRFGKVAEQEGAAFTPGSALSVSDYEDISTPVVSRRGQRALMYSSISCGGHCGYGFIQYLARQPAGHWRLLASHLLWQG